MDSSYFRDKMLSQMNIGYDWETSNNFSEVKLVSNHGAISIFKVYKLNEYLLYDDFLASYISHCKLIINNYMIYLSLDLNDELSNEIDLDNDCLWFKRSNIEVVQCS